MASSPTGTLQKIILWISAGTFITIASGIWFASAKVQKFDDKLDTTIKTVAEYKTKTDIEIYDIKKDNVTMKKDVSKIKECIAAHTGKTINGAAQ